MPTRRPGGLEETNITSSTKGKALGKLPEQIALELKPSGPWSQGHWRLVPNSPSLTVGFLLPFFRVKQNDTTLEE